MTQITIDTSHDFPDLVAKLSKTQQKLSDLSPLTDAIGALLENSTRQRFADKQAPNGATWQNLMPKTQATKGNNNILVQSGDLASSITYHANPYSTTVGTPEKYGAYHQFGTNKMVSRPFLGISSEDEQNIYALINDYLDTL